MIYQKNMLDKLPTRIEDKYFDKYLFYNCESHNIIGIPYVNYFNERLKFSNEMNFDNDKIKIWYVRNDDCADFIYSNNREQIESTIPKEIVGMINKKELFLVLSTGSEFDCDHFWDKVVNYCVEVGIDEENIHFITSNIKTQLPNSHSFKYSGLPHSKYDVGVCWLDKYGDIFPYTDEYIDRFKNVDKEKKFLCLNAHYREHRHYLYYKLFHHNLLSQGIFSFTLGQGINHVEHEKERMIEEWKSYSDYLDIENYDESLTILNFLPINIEEDNFWDEYYEIKNPKLKKYNDKYRPWTLKDIYMIEKTYFNISTESNCDGDHGKFSYFSEKALLGWITQPTILLGTPHTIKHFKGLGYESFDELFDESYDDIVDNDERQKKVVEEILRVCEMDEKKLKDICFNLLPKVQHNQKVLFEHDSIEEFAGFLESITND